MPGANTPGICRFRFFSMHPASAKTENFWLTSDRSRSIREVLFLRVWSAGAGDG
jgi:hypothetical protein